MNMTTDMTTLLFNNKNNNNKNNNNKNNNNNNNHIHTYLERGHDGMNGSRDGLV
jgi:hypothetical protein